MTPDDLFWLRGCCSVVAAGWTGCQTGNVDIGVLFSTLSPTLCLASQHVVTSLSWLFCLHNIVPPLQTALEGMTEKGTMNADIFAHVSEANSVKLIFLSLMFHHPYKRKCVHQATKK